MWSWNKNRLAVRWEGPFDGSFSFSVINRELCRLLASHRGIDLSVTPSVLTEYYSGRQNVLEDREFRQIAKAVDRRFERPVQAHIRHLVRDRFRAPDEGRWVIIQPWDFGCLPAAWMDWLNRVDEIWVPSSLMREGYLQSGIPPQRVHVVPNGVNTRRFHPRARRLNIKTGKGFKFLYVGGGLWRKGFDILLKAYTRAFTARDDVCLVVKSIPEFWRDEAMDLVRENFSRPNLPEVQFIIQSLEPLYLAALYVSCDCLIHPYRAEGFAIPVAEAMACGLPVILTEKGATRDFCTAENAILIEAEWKHLPSRKAEGKETLDYPCYLEPDLDSLIENMRWAYQHRMEAQHKGRLGQATIHSSFTWGHAARKVVSRLQELCQIATPLAAGAKELK